MKHGFKLGIVCLALSLVAAALPVAHGSYVSSPQFGGPTEVVGPVIGSDGADLGSMVVVTPFDMRHQLSADKLAHFLSAHREINMQAIYDLIKQEELLFAQSQYLSGKVEHLSVSDLFYVHEFEDRGLIDPSVGIVITVDLKLPQHAYHKVFGYVENEWRLAETKLNSDGTVTLTIYHWGPYAVVTEVYEEQDTGMKSPQTGVHLAEYGVLAVTAMGALLIAGLKKYEK